MNDALCIVEPEVVDELSVLGERSSSDACVWFEMIGSTQARHKPL
jgi:hypothetical protein